MFSGLSIGTRGSHQSPIAAAWRLVSDAENLQPALPVQAISPARISDAVTASPIASMAATTSPTFWSCTPGINRFCQTVRRISPSPRSRAIFASPSICSDVTLPSGNATPIQFTPGCFCLCTPICAMRSNAAHAQAKPDAGLDTESVLHLHRREGDVVGVFEHRDLAGAVERDVELARQSRQRTVIENVVVPLAGV